MALYTIPFPFSRCAWRGRGVDVSGALYGLRYLVMAWPSHALVHSMYLGEIYTKAVGSQRNIRFRDLIY